MSSYQIKFAENKSQFLWSQELVFKTLAAFVLSSWSEFKSNRTRSFASLLTTLLTLMPQLKICLSLLSAVVVSFLVGLILLAYPTRALFSGRLNINW